MTDRQVRYRAEQGADGRDDVTPRAAKRWATNTALLVSRRRPGIDEYMLDQEAILFDPGSGNTFQMNSTALAVWHQCDGRTTTRQIAERLTESYAVNFECALDHVDQLVALFADSHLLELEADV